MDQTTFNALAKAGYNRIPIYREVIVDLETPLTCYLKLANAPYSYLFESVEGGETWGRYSIIGLPCREFIQIHHHVVRHFIDQKCVSEKTVEDPFAWLEEVQQQFKLAPIAELPRFYGGFVGYFSYDTIRYIEPKLKLDDNKPNLLSTPDMMLLLTDELLIFDRLSNKLYLIVLADPVNEKAWDMAQQRLEQLYNQLHQPLQYPPVANTTSAREFQCSQTQTDYYKAIDKIKHYISAGDMMQTVYSIQFSTPYDQSPLQFYRALRHLNPSPYLYYLNMHDHAIAGSSPETLVHLENNTVTVRPIAGTRRRGETLAEDKALAEELLQDKKELAEHLMLIDLSRNDISRVCEVGTVNVTEKMIIERYSHVMHIVSQVQGKLRAGCNAFDVLRATFPAGTLSGAPKFRALEIIEELEPIRRCIYGGAVGYLSWHGNMDLAIAIRTAVIKNDQLYIQAGSGIVYDSIAENEWQECCNKAQALLSALALT